MDAALALGTTVVELRFLALDFARLSARDVKAEAQLMTSIGVVGQQHLVLVVVRPDGQRVLIDGYRRERALRRLGRDTILILVLSVSEADALAYCHRLATGRRRSALEEGWLARSCARRSIVDSATPALSRFLLIAGAARRRRPRSLPSHTESRIGS